MSTIRKRWTSLFDVLRVFKRRIFRTKILSMLLSTMAPFFPFQFTIILGLKLLNKKTSRDSQHTIRDSKKHKEKSSVVSTATTNTNPTTFRVWTGTSKRGKTISYSTLGVPLSIVMGKRRKGDRLSQKKKKLVMKSL